MSKQSELQLENKLIKQLVCLSYKKVTITDGEALVSNLKAQLEAFNKTSFSTKEFDAILNHLAKGNVFEKAKTLRDRFHITKDNGDSFYVRFFDSENRDENLFQVTNQITQEGTYKNRYDVTLLVNGLPLVQIELKRRGLEIKEAFNQVNRYQRHSFDSNYGLFQYVQLFVISNDLETQYFVNNRNQSIKQSYFWSDVNNKNIKDLTRFTNLFLNPDHLGKMIAQYVVYNETFKVLMVLRPYQYYAVEALVNKAKQQTDKADTVKANGYIWHTTGSGKTLTSFKASQIIMDLPNVDKVVFVVDRKDLDYQTMKEFNSFKKDSVSGTTNTKKLVGQLKDDSKLVVTTIQKLNNAITKANYNKSFTDLENKRVVFIFDECHRSQFGDTHKKITEYFKNSQLFGFTGTPIFAKNASKNDLGKRTTKDLFGECLHKYVITDAIRDDNVLKFSIEYIGRYKQKGNTFIDIDVADIDKSEVFADPKRLEKIADYIIKYHDTKTKSRQFSALFAVSDIDTLITYYDIFKRKRLAGEHDLRIATIFTYGTNEDGVGASDALPSTEEEKTAYAKEPNATYKKEHHSREKLDAYIEDYNIMFTQTFSTKDQKLFDGYFTDLTRRLKDREKDTFLDKDRLDIVIVVNMMLTGFDAKKVNTLYVDKNLQYHGLIQAFSRTNRIIGDVKSQGNILCFRNLKGATDEAITLFSNKEAIEDVILPDYNVVAEKLDDALAHLFKVTPSFEDIETLKDENEELNFVQAFRRVLRAVNVLKSYTDFSWDDLPIDEDTFNEYADRYWSLSEKVKKASKVDKTSILNDIDFELELIHRDQINVAYILQLLAKLKYAKTEDAKAQKKGIIDMLSGDVELRSKRELIEKFIEENLPHIDDVDNIQDEFERFWQDEKIIALSNLCEEEHLDKEQFKALIERYTNYGREPLRDDIFKCLDNRPSILKAREIGERILDKMKEFVQVFVNGMTG
ncbi:type I restriction endonuclease subunit R [Winogradskyella eximia]|uniref:type I restriction endonuclease subunit R n=1 Tax=Winogradskyella eximia TaxID=262006 RepID=UPI002492816E|nr:type I restriction endonuclease subunit R [Winogradskyella eximia]